MSGNTFAWFEVLHPAVRFSSFCGPCVSADSQRAGPGNGSTAQWSNRMGRHAFTLVHTHTHTHTLPFVTRLAAVEVGRQTGLPWSLRELTPRAHTGGTLRTTSSTGPTTSSVTRAVIRDTTSWMTLLGVFQIHFIINIISSACFLRNY